MAIMAKSTLGKDIRSNSRKDILKDRSTGPTPVLAEASTHVMDNGTQQKGKNTELSKVSREAKLKQQRMDALGHLS